jgi:hypothetical protein
LFLGVSVRRILHTPLFFLDPYRRSGFRYFKGIATDVDAGLDESLVVSPPSAEVCA